jgi:hypothetical protein
MGGLFFVEDGHHRTSVARDLGLDTIEAAVIAYPVSFSLNADDSLEVILAGLADWTNLQDWSNLVSA